MKTVNIQDAKTHLSKLIDAAAKGEPFIIAKTNKPMSSGRSTRRRPVPTRIAHWRTRASKVAHLAETCAAILSAILTCRRIQPAASRSRSAAASGVRSRCGEPSISKPTMNFLIVAERRSGG